MNRKHFHLLGAVSILLLLSCSPSSSVQRQATTTPVLGILNGIENGQLFTSGEGYIQGEVTGGALAPGKPLVMRVEDLDTRLAWEVDILKESTSGRGTTTLNLATGEFAIDLTTGRRLGEGRLAVSFLATMSDDQQLQERFMVHSSAQYADFPKTRMIAARKAYGLEMIKLLESYKNWLESQSWDADSFPTAPFEMAVLQSFETYYEHWHTHPDRVGWLEAQQTCYDRLAALPDTYALLPSGPMEQAEAAMWGAWDLVSLSHESLASEEARMLLRPATDPAGEGTALWESKEDFYLHTYTTSESQQMPDGEVRWIGIVYTDDNTPNRFDWSAGYVSAVVPGSADPATSVFLLEVVALDTNQDSAIDTLSYEAIGNIGEDWTDYTVGELGEGGDALGLLEPLQTLARCWYWE